MLPEFWFILVAVLWAGFFVLEGFDFGVGALFTVVAGRHGPTAPTAETVESGPAVESGATVETDRRAVLGTVGPVWDGNEVWLLTAGGAMFAAFPEWYASLFSGFYLALFAVLVALIIRGVALEYRGKAATAAGRAWCDAGIIVGGVLPPVLFGVAFANIVRGVVMTPDHEVRSSLLDLLNPFGLLGGVMMLLLCLLHGAVFIALKTEGRLRRRARATARVLVGPTVAALVAFLAWTQTQRADFGERPVVLAVSVVAVLAAAGAALAWRADRDGWAFIGTAGTLALVVAVFFTAIHPEVLPALGGGEGLTIDEAASSHYTLVLMTVVALIVTPVVLAYQSWSYWVFRRRVFGSDAPAASPPARVAAAVVRAGARTGAAGPVGPKAGQGGERS